MVHAYRMTGGDIAVPLSYMADGVQPALHIDYCDTNVNIIKGSFEIAFKLINPPNTVVDSIIYRDATFLAFIHPYDEFYTVRY